MRTILINILLLIAVSSAFSQSVEAVVSYVDGTPSSVYTLDSTETSIHALYKKLKKPIKAGIVASVEFKYKEGVTLYPIMKPYMIEYKKEYMESDDIEDCLKWIFKL